MNKKIRPINKRIHYKQDNAQNVLDKVEKWIKILETRKAEYPWRTWAHKVSMWEVCDELSIFDWWVDELSVSRLKEMRTFLREAIKLGYNGYVCFKVGMSGCANGMWAHKNESINGFSPDGEFLYRSFTPDYTYWDITYPDMPRDMDRLSYRVGKEYDELKTTRDLEKAIKELKEMA